MAWMFKQRHTFLKPDVVVAMTILSKSVDL